MPKEGSEIDIWERLQEYIIPVDKEWRNKVIGATEQEIEELREKSGLKERNIEFPKAYLEFAKRMGKEDGGLLDDRLVGIGSISDILNMYREEEENEQYRKRYIYPYDEMVEELKEELLEEEKEEFCFYFFWNEIGMWYGINLEDNKNDYIQNDEGEIISENFEKLLFQCAISKYENKYYMFYSEFSACTISLERAIELNGEEIEEVIDGIIKKYDLKKAWFSDDWNSIVYSDMLTIYIDKTSSLNGSICSNNKIILKEIEKEIFTKLGAVETTYLEY